MPVGVKFSFNVYKVKINTGYNEYSEKESFEAFCIVMLTIDLCLVRHCYV
jgi:hypothetical protein